MTFFFIMHVKNDRLPKHFNLLRAQVASEYAKVYEKFMGKSGRRRRTVEMIF